MEASHRGHRHPAGEDRPDPGSPAFEGTALGAVADQQQGHRRAPVAQQRRRVDERVDALVAVERRGEPDHERVLRDAQFVPERRPVREGFQERRVHRVRHDGDLRGVDAAFRDLVAHGRAERDDRVGLAHPAGLQLPGQPVEVGLGGVRRVARQPRVLQEAPDLVHHRQPVPAAQLKGHRRVQVVADRVQDLWPQPLDERTGQVGGLADRRDLVARRQPRQQPVVDDPVDLDGAPCVGRPLAERVPEPGHHMRVEPELPLGERDPVRPDRVPRIGPRQGVRHELQDPSRNRCRYGSYRVIGSCGQQGPQIAGLPLRIAGTGGRAGGVPAPYPRRSGAQQQPQRQAARPHRVLAQLAAGKRGEEDDRSRSGKHDERA